MEAQEPLQEAKPIKVINDDKSCISLLKQGQLLQHQQQLNQLQSSGLPVYFARSRFLAAHAAELYPLADSNAFIDKI